MGSFTFGTQSISKGKEGLQAVLKFVAQVTKVLEHIRRRTPRENGIRIISRRGGAAWQATDREPLR